MRKMVWLLLSVFVCASYAEMVPSGMSLAMFMSGRIQEPTVFKVEVAVSPWDATFFDTVSEGFSEGEFRNLYWVVKVRPYRSRYERGALRYVTCCVKKGSKAGSVVKEFLKDGGYHAAHVQMRYSSGPELNKCCVIDEIEILSSEYPDITAKFSNTRIGIVKSKGLDYVQGTVTANIRSELKYFKKPIVRVILLTNENGSRVIRDTIVDEPNIKMINHSDSVEHHTTTFGNDNNEPWGVRKYIEEISINQSEVSKEQFSKVSYVGLPLGGNWGHGIKGPKWRNMFGFARFDKDENAKLIGYRIEMWQKGNCVEVYDTVRPSMLRRLELPEDWHVSFKYPEKFKYRSPFSRKHVVLD